MSAAAMTKTMEAKAAVIFDFDGVLIDSVDEVIVTAYYRAYGLDPAVWTQPPAEFTAFMRSNRCRAKSAGEIALSASWARAHAGKLPDHIVSAAEFSEMTCVTREALQLAEKEFFAARRGLMRQQRARWLALNRPYQPLWEALQRNLAGAVQILTYKNREAVRELCMHFGLDVALENIQSTRAAESKREHLARLAAQSGAPLYYIDDSLRNLTEIQEAAAQTVTLLWAAWGYCTPEDGVTAGVQGVRAVQQEDVIRLLEQRRAESESASPR